MNSLLKRTKIKHGNFTHYLKQINLCDDVMSGSKLIVWITYKPKGRLFRKTILNYYNSNEGALSISFNANGAWHKKEMEQDIITEVKWIESVLLDRQKVKPYEQR